MKLTDLLHRHDLRKGIFLVLIGWLCVSTMFAISKLIGPQTTVPTMLFFRNIFGIFLALPWIIKHWPRSLKIYRPKLVVVRSLMGLLNLLFILLAIEKISLVNTTLLNNSAPFFVPLIIWIWLRIPINHKIWPAIITGFIGIALILQPDQRIFNLGAIYALISGVCSAISLVMIRMTARSETLYTLLLYFFLIGLIVTTPFAIFDWRIDSIAALIGLFGIGLFSAFGQVFLFSGMKHGKAHQLASFSYATVVFSGVYEFFFWGVIPPSIAYLGMAFIIASGVWIVFVSRLPKK